MSNHDKINVNEYLVCEGNIEHTVRAAKYRLKKGKATFWYWRKNIFTNRYELLSFELDNIKSVSQVIDAVPSGV